MKVNTPKPLHFWKAMLPAQLSIFQCFFLACFLSTASGAEESTRPLAPAPRYRITELDLEDYEFGFATGISDDGIVVGTVAKNGNSFAATWNAKGELHTFPEFKKLSSFASKISSTGCVVGTVCHENETQMFFVEEGRVKLIENKDAGVSLTGVAINRKKMVAGLELAKQRQQRAILWDNEKVTHLVGMEEIGGINDQGTVVGTSSANGGKIPQAVKWKDGKLTVLAPQWNSKSEAVGINNSDMIVVNSKNSRGKQAAFLWDQGVLSELPSLTESGAANAMGITDGGIVFGKSTIDATPLANAVLWSNQQVIDLNDRLNNGRGWHLGNALAINAAGQITCTAARAGKDRPVRLDPISDSPEMAAATVVKQATSRQPGRDEHPFGTWDEKSRVYTNNFITPLRCLFEKEWQVHFADPSRGHKVANQDLDYFEDATALLELDDFLYGVVVDGVLALPQGETMEMTIHLKRLAEAETVAQFGRRVATESAIAIAKEVGSKNPPALSFSKAWISGREFHVAHIDIVYGLGVVSTSQYVVSQDQTAIIFDWAYSHPIVRSVLDTNMKTMVTLGPAFQGKDLPTSEIENSHDLVVRTLDKAFRHQNLSLLKELNKSQYNKQAHAILATENFLDGANRGGGGFFDFGATQAGNIAGANAAWADAIEAGQAAARTEMMIFEQQKINTLEILTEDQRKQLADLESELFW